MNRYFITFGNTSVYVEDLMLTKGCVQGIGGTMIYPGVCQHCGKTNIRYLAHVRQDLADTMARATGDDTENGEAFTQVDDDQFCKDSAAFCDGKASKEIEVGCVCVGKYLTDCGVDNGLARRMQDEVSKIMHILQKIAQLEAAKLDSHLDKAAASYETVVTLRERMSALRNVKYWDEPALKEQDALRAFHSLRATTWRDFEDSSSRWKRENFGYYANFSASGQADRQRLIDHFDYCISREQRKLTIYQNGPRYVNA